MKGSEKRIPVWFILLSMMVSFIPFQQVEGQKLKTMAANTFNGAMTGGILGGATMALQNSAEFDPVRFGVGLGTLGGLAFGIHDVAQASQGQKYVVDGVFNKGHATSVIILMDTIYGGAAGVLVGTSINLMAEEPIVNGIQYGAGAGLWGGFLFGLMDALLLSQHRTVSQSTTLQQFKAQKAASQLLVMKHRQTRISFLQPHIYTYKTIQNEWIKQKAGLSISMVEFSVSL